MDDMRPAGRNLDFGVVTAWGADLPAADQVDATGPSGDLADRASAGLHLDPAVGLSVLHVVIPAGRTRARGSLVMRTAVMAVMAGPTRG